MVKRKLRSTTQNSQRKSIRSSFIKSSIRSTHPPAGLLEIRIDDSAAHAAKMDNLVKPLNPLLSMCGYQVMSPTAVIPCRAALSTENTYRRRKKAKRTIY